MGKNGGNSGEDIYVSFHRQKDYRILRQLGSRITLQVAISEKIWKKYQKNFKRPLEIHLHKMRPAEIKERL